MERKCEEKDDQMEKRENKWKIITQKLEEKRQDRENVICQRKRKKDIVDERERESIVRREREIVYCEKRERERLGDRGNKYVRK